VIVNTDFAGIVQDLRAELEKRGAWKDLLRSSTGETLLEFLAGVATFANYSVERAVHELFLDTAQHDASIFALARFLGVMPELSSGGRMPIQLRASTVPVSIPRYTPVLAGTARLYLPENIVLTTSGLSVSAELRQGEIREELFTALGGDYQSYTLGLREWRISDDVFHVYVDGTEWTRVENRFWGTDPNGRYYMLDVTRDGGIIVRFPPRAIGVIPPQGVPIRVQYAVVDPSAQVSTSQSLTIDGYPQVSVTPLEALSAGSPHQTADDLRYLAPRLYASGWQAVRRQDWDAIVRAYDDLDIADARVWAEGDLAYRTTAEMNRVHIAVLPAQAVEYTAIIQVDDNGNASGTLPQVPVHRGSVRLEYGGDVLTDDGNGVLRTAQSIPNEIQALYTISGVHEVQQITFTLGNAPSGTFRIRFGNYISRDMRYDVSSAEMESVLEELPTIQRVSIHREASGNLITWTITFLQPGAADVAQMEIDDAQLLHVTSAVQTLVQGVSGGILRVQVDGHWSPVFAWDAPAEAVKAAIASIPTVDDVTVSGLGTQNDPWIVVFPPGRDYPEMLVDTSALQGTAHVSTTVDGVSPGTGTVDYETGAISAVFTTQQSGQATATWFLAGIDSAGMQQLAAYLERYKHMTTQLVLESPTAVPVQVRATIHHLPQYDAQQIEQQCRGALTAEYARKPGILGKHVVVSDIYRILSTVEGVDYITLHAPTADISVANDAFPYLQYVELTPVLSDRV